MEPIHESVFMEATNDELRWICLAINHIITAENHGDAWQDNTDEERKALDFLVLEITKRIDLKIAKQPLDYTDDRLLHRFDKKYNNG